MSSFVSLIFWKIVPLCPSQMILSSLHQRMRHFYVKDWVKITNDR